MENRGEALRPKMGTVFGMLSRLGYDVESVSVWKDCRLYINIRGFLPVWVSVTGQAGDVHGMEHYGKSVFGDLMMVGRYVATYKAELRKEGRMAGAFTKKEFERMCETETKKFADAVAALGNGMAASI